MGDKTWDDWVEDVWRLVEKKGAEYVNENFTADGLLILLRNNRKLLKERDAWMAEAEKWKHFSNEWEALYKQRRRGY